MFPKAARKWKLQNGYDGSSIENGNKKLEEETKLSKKDHAPYLEAARVELKNFRAAENALRKLNRARSFESKVNTALEHASDTLVKALVQEARHTQYEYSTHVKDSVSSESAGGQLAMQTSPNKNHDTPDPPCRHDSQEASESGSMEESCVQVGLDAGGDSESELNSSCSPVLMWESSPSKKHHSHDGYVVRVEKKKEHSSSGYSDSHGLITHLELNRIVEVEPTLPNDVKIVKRNGVNLIVSTASPIPPNTETITVTASDLQTCGHDLSMLRARTLKKNEEPEGNIMEITLNKRYGEKLGVSVEFEDIQITSIHHGGVLALWNESNPESCVQIGSRILEANGKNETNEKLKELRDATYATMISLKIECFQGEPEGISEVKEEEKEEEFVFSWADKHVIPCCTQNDGHMNEVWFPPSPKELDDEESAPRRPGKPGKRRSDSCPPSPSRARKQKPSLPPVDKVARRHNSRPRSRECSSAPSSAKGSRDGRNAAGSRPASSQRRITSNPRESRSASLSCQMLSASSVEKLPPLA